MIRAARCPARARRRRPGFPGAERREGILRAARRSFTEFGYHGARTREIAERAGRQQAVVYRHFASKEELFDAAVLLPLTDRVEAIPVDASTVAAATTADRAGLVGPRVHAARGPLGQVVPSGSRRPGSRPVRDADRSSVRRVGHRGAGRSLRGSATTTRAFRLYALYVLALLLGMRRAELLGLPWDAVDLDKGMLEVRQSLQRVKGELRIVPVKSRTSERPVPLPGICVEALKAHRVRQAAELGRVGGPECGLVFTTTTGTPIEPDNLRRSWYPLRARAGLDHVRFHDLRHSCVTLLLDLGVPPHVVMQIVGHATLDVTMKIYAHGALDEQRSALDKLERRLNG